MGGGGKVENSRLGPEAEPGADSCLLRSSVLISLHKHFEWTLLVFLSSRHLSHWETGRPLRLTSNSGRSVWLQEEVRCPLMQDSLMRVPLSVVCMFVCVEERWIPCKLLLVDVDLLGKKSQQEG